MSEQFFFALPKGESSNCYGIDYTHDPGVAPPFTAQLSTSRRCY